MALAESGGFEPLPYQHHALSSVGEPTDGLVAHPSAVVYQIGGRTYSMKSAPNCKTCRDDRRVDIENMLIKGRGYAAIVRSLAMLPAGTSIQECEAKAGLSKLNLTNHVTGGHMPSDQSVRRVALETRARDVALDYEDADGTVVDHVGLLQEVTRLTYERIAMGEERPSIADGIRAARALAAIGLHADSEIDQQTTMDLLAVFFDSARAIMSPEQFQRFGQSLAENQTLRLLRDRHQAKHAMAIEVGGDDDS